MLASAGTPVNTAGHALAQSISAAQIRPVREEARVMEHRFDNLDVDEGLRVIAGGTATTTGKSFYASLVESLAGTLNTTGASVTEYLRDTQRLRALAASAVIPLITT